MTVDRKSGKAPLSVARILQILRVLSEAEAPLSLAALSRQLGTPKTSLIGLLHGLVEQDFVVFAEGTYRLGGGAFDLANAVLAARQRSHLTDYIRSGMNELSRQSGETVLYGVLTSDLPAMLTYVGIVESRSAIRVSVGIGDRSPTYCTAGGRVLLADLPDEDVRRQLKSASLKAINSHTETDPERLLALIIKAREEQFSCVRDEMIQGIYGMAAPVRDSSSRAIGSLIIAGPSGRSIEDEGALREMVCACARRISQSLGYREGQAAPA